MGRYISILCTQCDTDCFPPYACFFHGGCRDARELYCSSGYSAFNPLAQSVECSWSCMPSRRC